MTTPLPITLRDNPAIIKGPRHDNKISSGTDHQVFLPRPLKYLPDPTINHHVVTISRHNRSEPPPRPSHRKVILP